MELKLDDLKATIVISYDEAMAMVNHSNDVCGCCKDKAYSDWYVNGNAFFVKKGVFIVDGLLLDNSTPSVKMRYSILFSFENPLRADFTVLNYYTQELVSKFNYVRADNETPYMPKVKTDYLNYDAFYKFGDFLNEPMYNKLSAMMDAFSRRYSAVPKKKLTELIKKEKTRRDNVLSTFMWEHTVDIIHSTMFYFTMKRPTIVPYESFTETNKPVNVEISDLFYVKKTKYLYTGYINLNKTKIYRANIDKELEAKKRGEYERHIEKWSVRGHHRTLPNGEKIWIEPHTKGEGRLENRIYGTKDEKDMLLIPKVFEVDKIVFEQPPITEVEKLPATEEPTEQPQEPIATTEQPQEPQPQEPIATTEQPQEPIEQPQEPITKADKIRWWRRLINSIKNIIKIKLLGGVIKPKNTK